MWPLSCNPSERLSLGCPVAPSILAPSDFELFAKLKPALGGICFHFYVAIEQWCRQYFRKLDASYYDAGICKLLSHYEKCLHNLGDYVEK